MRLFLTVSMMGSPAPTFSNKKGALYLDFVKFKSNILKADFAL
jgi:hypothetical protein